MSIENKSVENGFDSTTGSGDNAPFIGGAFVPSKVEYSITAGASNISIITIQYQDGHGGNLAAGIVSTLWLSDDPLGVGLTATTASGTVVVTDPSTQEFGILTAKKAFIVQTLGDGSIVLNITDSAKTLYFICVQSPYSGLTIVSRRLTTDDYGA